MILKLKIYTTAVVLYEIIAVLLLHFPRVCDVMFGAGFCDDRVFKYFIALFAVPALVLLIIMWIMEIVKAAHRRRSLMYKAKSAVKDIVANVRDKVSANVSTQDLEKLAVAAMLASVRKYTHRHPKMAHKLDDVLDMDIANGEDSYYEEDDEDDEEDDDRTSRSKSSRGNRGGNSARRGSKSSSNNKRKR